MNANINNQLIETAIENCKSIDYPILVTGQDFGDDLANALHVVKELNKEVDRLKRIIDKLLEANKCT